MASFGERVLQRKATVTTVAAILLGFLVPFSADMFAEGKELGGFFFC